MFIAGAYRNTLCRVKFYIYVTLQEFQIHRRMYASDSNPEVSVHAYVITAFLHTKLPAITGSYGHSINSICIYGNCSILFELEDSMF